MLALAGIFSDARLRTGGGRRLASTGTVRQVALTLCAFQLTMLVTNLNPLTQSDGVAAIEAPPARSTCAGDPCSCCAAS